MPLPIRQDDLLLRLIKDVSDIQSALRRVVANLPLFDISNESTPAQIISNVNDYVPGNYDCLRLSSDAARTITGFRGGVRGRFLRLFNVGAFEITISHLSGLSALGNRVKSPTGTDIIINAGGQLVLYYDITNNQWIASYATNSDRISVELRLNATQSIPDAAFTDISWTDVISDTGGFFNAGTPTIITIPESGWYTVNACVVFAINGTGMRATLVRSFPSSYISLIDDRTAVTAANTTANMNRVCFLPQGVTVGVRVFQNSTAPLNVEINAGAALGTALIVSKM